MQFKDESRLRRSPGIRVGIVCSLAAFTFGAQGQNQHGPVDVPPGRDRIIELGRNNVNDDFGDVNVEARGKLTLDASALLSNQKAKITRGKIRNHGLLILKSKAPIAFTSNISIENEGIIIIENQGRRNLRPTEQASFVNRDIGLIIGQSGAWDGDIVNEGTIFVGDRSKFPELFPAPITSSTIASSSQATQSTSKGTGSTTDITTMAIPNSLLFTINGTLGTSTGEAVVGVSWNGTSIEYGQLDVGANVTLSNSKLTVNVSSDAASRLAWNHNFEIIRATSLIGDFSTFAFTGLTGSGFRLGHRVNLTGAPDQYFLDVLNYPSSAAAGSIITVRGDFVTAPTAANFLFAGSGGTFVPAQNITKINDTQLSVTTPLTGTVAGRLRWTRASTGADAGQTVTFSNFTPIY